MGHSGVSASRHQPGLCFPGRAGFPAHPECPLPAFLHATKPSQANQSEGRGGLQRKPGPSACPEPGAARRAPLTADHGASRGRGHAGFTVCSSLRGTAPARPALHRRGPGADDERAPGPVRPPRASGRWCRAAPRVHAACARCHSHDSGPSPASQSAHPESLPPRPGTRRDGPRATLPPEQGWPPPPVAPTGSAPTTMQWEPPAPRPRFLY